MPTLRVRIVYITVAMMLMIVNGYNTHTITVGALGETIDPPFLVAQADDIVTFVFSGDFHTVTQSTFENPFVPLRDGFDSGLAGIAPDGSMSTRTWELRVTDILHPLWFFCKRPQPTSHCKTGLVGSINPPNQTMYNIFASAAKQNSCTLTHTSTTMNSSIIIPTSIPEVPGIPSPTQASFANAATETAGPVSKRSHRGAIIGGVIGGVLGLLSILLAAYLYFFCRCRRRSRTGRVGTGSLHTYESKLNSNILNLRLEATTPPPSASSDKNTSLQLNADRTKTDTTDAPSLEYIGAQQPPEQADVVTSPVTVSSSSPDNPGPALFANPKEVDTSQQIETIPGPTVFRGSAKPPIISSREDEGPVFFERPVEADREELSPSTYRTPMGARLREDPIYVEAAHPEYGTVIGIDLGTSYSRVGVQRDGKFEIIPNDRGQRATPSWVCFAGKRRLVGDFSQDFNPDNTVFSVKRLIGRKMEDQDMIQDSQHWPFKVRGKNGTPTITVKINGRERSFTAEEITATIIKKMKETAEVYLGHKVTHAVVTVPACFNDSQRQATKDAGKIAGLNIVRILNEPTAAAIGHSLYKKGASRVLVYSLGGGFFDVSLLSVDDSVFEVLATTGDAHLGGEDFDNRVVNYLSKLYQRKTGTDISQNFLALAKLKSEVEKAKRSLSSEQTARIDITSFENGNDFSEVLSRAKFEELNIDLFGKTIRLVEQAIRDANCKKEEIDEVLLVGGSTRIPRIQQLLKQLLTEKEPSKDIDPDDAMIRGAAIQGGILSGSEKTADIILVDICPHSLGIETIGEFFAVVVPRNTAIPTKRSENFTTVYDNQISVIFSVFEGEHSRTMHNNLLGTFTLSGVLPAPRGVPQFEVTFEIDASGILHVRAVDKGTGNSGSITIVTNKGRLSQEEIMRMQAEGCVAD